MMMRAILPIAVVAAIAVTPPSARAAETFSLKSVSIAQPTSDRAFPDGPGSDAINNNCLICHSAGMVLNQPYLSKTAWLTEVTAMVEQYKAPIDPREVDTIVDYLVSIRGPNSTAAGEQNTSRQGDPNHGAVIAAQGIGSDVPACAQCHAFNGSSDGSGAFPRIADQSTYYLTKQLRDFASGVRANAVMSPVAKGLSPDDIADVIAYYSGVKAPFLPLASAEPALLRRGEQLAEMGNATKDIPACNNCHGPHGGGEPPAIPYLAGQYARYIVFELQMWQRGYRQNSPEIMRVIATKLDDQDIVAVAAYYQQLSATRQTSASK
jgi:cytochrome c553